jgi:hypothetical protein
MNRELISSTIKPALSNNSKPRYFVGYEDLDGFWSTYETDVEQDAKEAVLVRRKKDGSKDWVIYESVFYYNKLNF